jgi:integrase
VLRGVRDSGVDPALADKEARAQQAVKAEEKRAGAYTVERLVDDYLTGHIDTHRKPKGRAEVRRMLTRNLAPIALEQASTLKRQQAFELLEGLAATPVQAASMKGELGAAWDYALDAGRLPEETPNWWRLIMRGKLRSKGKVLLGESTGPVKRVLNDKETGALIRWLPNFTRLADDALTLYLWTCTRGAEIMAMEAAEITEEADGLWWTVPKAKTKNAPHPHATDLRVPLVGRAEVVVRRRLEERPTGYLFPSTGRGAYPREEPQRRGMRIGSAVGRHRAEIEPLLRLLALARRLRLLALHAREGLADVRRLRAPVSEVRAAAADRRQRDARPAHGRLRTLMTRTPPKRSKAMPSAAAHAAASCVY